MIANIFSLIQLILKALSLWEGFLDSVEAKDAADAEERRQRRNKAADDATKAVTPEDAWKAQDEIVRNGTGNQP